MRRVIQSGGGTGVVICTGDSGVLGSGPVSGRPAAAAGNNGLLWFGERAVYKSNGSAWAALFSGVPGNIYTVKGTIRPGALYGNPWTVLDDSSHTPIGLHSTSIVDNAAGFSLTVNYKDNATGAAITFAEVLGSSVVCDETLNQFFDVGASVGNSSAVISFTRKKAVAARLAWNGSAWAIDGFNGMLRPIADATPGIVSQGGGEYLLNLAPWVDSQPGHLVISNCDPGGTLPAGRLTAAASTTAGSSNTARIFLRDSAGALTVAGGGHTAEFVVMVADSEEFNVRPQRISQEAYPLGFGASSNVWIEVNGILAPST